MRGFSGSWAIVTALLVAGGCASTPEAGTAARADERSPLRCPAGSSMVCEADRIGRISHGTFSRNVEKCACVPDDSRTLDTPVIPSTQR